MPCRRPCLPALEESELPNALYLNFKNEVDCFCLGLPLNETVISEVFSGALGLLTVSHTGSRMF